MRVYIDTNVIIDLLAQREPFYKDVFKLFEKIADNHLIGYTSVKSLSDVYYVLHRTMHSHEEAGRMIVRTMTLLQVADNTDFDLLRTFSCKTNDFEDNLITQLSSRLMLDYIVSRNVKDFDPSFVKAITPKECLDILELSQLSAEQ
ncbi:MAG: PIN domain-containing protein [Erysipelotrichaceae bacterium]|nr:PIN domain-containing protein [Erysipelotrichaceae bacterium]